MAEEANDLTIPEMVPMEPPKIHRGAPTGSRAKRLRIIQAVVDQLRKNPGQAYQVDISPQTALNWRKASPEFADMIVQTRQAPEGSERKRLVFLSWPSDE